MYTVQLSIKDNGKSHSVNCHLDFADQEWSIPNPSGLWAEIVYSTTGKFEMRNNGVIWFWDGFAPPKRKNTIIIRNPPKSPGDMRHRSGNGQVFAPKNKSVGRRVLSWKTIGPVTAPVSSGGPLSPIRRRIMAICDLKVPKGIKYNYVAGPPRSDGAGVTNCNIFVGLILSYINGKDRRKMFKRIAGEPFAQPRFEWYKYARKIDRERSPSVSTWVPFAPGKIPKPGDIYQLTALQDKGKIKKGMTQHIGIIESASASMLNTIDGGQKAEEGQPSYACKRLKRAIASNGVTDGEYGSKAKLLGWVDMHRLAAAVPEVIPHEYQAGYRSRAYGCHLP